MFETCLSLARGKISFTAEKGWYYLFIAATRDKICKWKLTLLLSGYVVAHG